MDNHLKKTGINCQPVSTNISTSTWMYLAQPGGIIFIYLHFVEPYFHVRFLQWNNSCSIVIRQSVFFKLKFYLYK